MGFADTYLGRLRAIVGERRLLVPGARAVIEDAEGRLLLQERSDFHLWGLPGGNAELGDSIEDVIRREVLEETGLVLGSLEVFGLASDPQFETVVYPNGHECQYVVALFTAREFDGEPYAADEESSAVAWFSAAALPSLLPNMRRTIEAYRRFRNGGGFQMI